MSKKKLRKISCRVCKAYFTPFNSLEVWCSPQCGYDLSKERAEAKIKREAKEFRKETREMKEKAKTRAKWLDELQSVVNKYTRLRDKGLPCVSCDKPDDGTHQRHASHFKSVGSNSALRFNLWNIHASCSQCNNHLSGNIGEYIPRLINKIGRDKYDWLLTQNQTVKYDIEYIKRFKKIFNKRIRMIESRL